MAPALQDRSLDLDGASAGFRTTWASPSTYAFTILLLVGGDVISMALAQLSGGWVSYATGAINAAVGQNKLMLPADTPCMVINAENKQSRGNGSWILGRVMRDFEYWMGRPVREKVTEVKKSKYQYDMDQAMKNGKDVQSVQYPAHAGLVVSFWKTRGNGAQHALVIEADGFGLNLEDLCTGFDNLDEPSIPVSTRFAVVILGVLWVVLLITSSAITNQSWYLIAVGLIGMLQNIFVAAWSRKPEAFGLPLKFENVIGSPKVFTAITECEKAYPTVGRALVGTFFPSGIYPKEEEALAKIEAEEQEKQAAKKATTA
ncbi:hypothetical protein ONZ43_g7428 [Nemania bipapillata]|uniref:Uncharacterized protein n=1 Tax=Nemania bipapillata TaxID=110536 RepID=A0ACC2HRD0_9PEZI|nr:hypothetical protein ONZ43_g7428 [Nemania bipapillata]